MSRPGGASAVRVILGDARPPSPANAARRGWSCATLTGVRDSTWPLVVLLLLAVAAVTVAVLRRRDGGLGAATGSVATVGGAASSGTTAGAERFRRGGRFTRGYRRDEVDAFFDRIEAGGVSAQEIEDVVFGSATGLNAYDESEVDDALDRAVDRLRRAV
jgi:DivIVA domain-containing protein